jgi:glycosyltransferase involved in cell wall biosynthesis
MRVLVTSGARFAITNDGTLWTQNPSFSYRIWARYLKVYDEVNILARAKLHSVPPDNWIMASGPGVKAIPLPYYVGPWEFLKNYSSIKKIIRKALVEAEAIQLSDSLSDENWLLASQRPYGIEVISDPYDVFAPGSIRHPLRPFFRWWFKLQLQKQCAGACAALYVTKEALQRRYPCPNYSVGISDVDLPDQALVSPPRLFDREARTFTLIIVGSLAQLYKAPDVLIDALASCVRDGLDLKLVLVGDGKYRLELEKQAANLGIGDRVYFRGQLPSRDAVYEQLDRADVFVLPSHQEGLPRAMVEAMARGLPCIGSTVGGIPELLPVEDMVPPGDAVALAHKIQEVVTNPTRMTLMSARNLDKAKEYRESLLAEQRLAFYHYVREKTEVWLDTRKQ